MTEKRLVLLSLCLVFSWTSMKETVLITFSESESCNITHLNKIVLILSY